VAAVLVGWREGLFFLDSGTSATRHSGDRRPARRAVPTPDSFLDADPM
jgi:hypothetical protein